LKFLQDMKVKLRPYRKQAFDDRGEF